MNPQLSREPALHLPQPAPEQGAWQPVQSQPESAAARPEVSLSPAQPVPPAVVPFAQPMAQPLQISQPLAQQSAQILPTQQATTTDDEDKDIDKVWVSKARQIVEQTHADPFLESKELGKVKVEYLKKRYNKDVKAAEAKP